MHPPSTPRAWTRYPVAAGVLAVFTLSLLLRLLFLLGSEDRHWPFSIFFYGDSRFFHGYALEWARGQPARAELPYHPPLFPWVLGGLYRLLGEPRGSALPYKVSLAVLNSATVALTWVWWRRLLGAGWGLLGAALFAASFGWLVLSTTYSNEGLYALWLSATCALGVWHQGRLTWGMAALLGVAMGLGSLTRAEHLYLWPFLAAGAWLQRERGAPVGPQLARWGVALAVCAVVLAPWAVRNARALQAINARTPQLEPLPELAPVTVYGPINFSMANQAQATGGFSPESVNRLGQEAYLDAANPAQRHLLVHGYTEGLRWLAGHPLEAARLLAAKVGLWLGGLSLGWGVSNLPSGLRGARAPVDLFVPERPWLQWPLAALLVLGVGLSWRGPYRAFSVLSLVVLHRALITLAFFGYARGLLVLFPALVPLLLLPLKAWASRHAPRSERWPVLAACVLALLWVEAGVRALGTPRRLMASGSTDHMNGKLIQDAEVRIWPVP